MLKLPLCYEQDDQDQQLAQTHEDLLYFKSFPVVFPPFHVSLISNTFLLDDTFAGGKIPRRSGCSCWRLVRIS